MSNDELSYDDSIKQYVYYCPKCDFIFTKTFNDSLHECEEICLGEL